MTTINLKDMTISEIAALVESNWKPVNYAARPYLDAMYSMDKITDHYGCDSGHSIVAYFLSNATRWTGAAARDVKKELNRRLKGK